MTATKQSAGDKVIFLDVDGVLNSRAFLATYHRAGIAIDPTRLVLLRQIVEASGADIVLTSSWRLHWDSNEALCNETGKQMNAIFAQAGLKILDKTPDLGFVRYEEVVRWLEEHPQVKNFVVLDDEPFEEGILKGHFVLTSRLRRGLDEEDVQKAIAILQ